ncbi:peroxisome membrane protein [Cryphonectria parasitica EP155]|uniref:Peroxisomal membrane protein PEX16 n=1 Tax=Cryphonectria parasitica (strain ATCC 38755 / EP155) TaxID=660469 RepID=A0A9P4Y898_CRYP1|nr:peroxisome membrane protein [Cryphonectria parasitica EP155]KAF3768598.1 peroxisome membrane protein [Cryphonectria parasitica EP155]
MASPADSTDNKNKTGRSPVLTTPNLRSVISLPPKWLARYDDFVTKNASQVAQMESALRSLTYIIPGRFRDAELATEGIHSGVQLLSLYHDLLLFRATTSSSPSPSASVTPSASSNLARSLHARYTRFWAAKSDLYRRVAIVLQVVQYTELLLEMWAKRRGQAIRWRVVVLVEAIKALCRLLLLKITRSRPLVTPALPERERAQPNGHAPPPHSVVDDARQPHNPRKEWSMPRTGLTLPSLPARGDISSYLLARVLTADDIKPATKLLHTLRGSASTAEVLYILAPLVYALALARTDPSRRRASWTPWLVGLSVQLAARQLALRARDGSPRNMPALEKEEWARRGRTMWWWLMRGAAYEHLVKGVVGGVRRRVPGFVGTILEDYEYLWENYYFSTSDL